MLETNKTTQPETLKDALALVNELRNENMFLHHSLDKLRRMIFSSTSEKLAHKNTTVEDGDDSIQQDIFAEEAAKAIPAVATPEKVTYERIKSQNDGHGRRKIPDTIKRTEVIVDISDEEKTCDCGCLKKRIGEDVAEELDYIPAHIEVKKTIRPRYACPKCPDKGVQTATVPSKIIPKGFGTSSLYAHILVSKFRWHLPLYRQEKIFDHYGIPINRSVMCGWEKQLLPCLEDIYDTMKKKLLSAPYLQSDETTLPVRDMEKAGKIYKGYLWPYTDGNQILFDFRNGRGREGPLEFLKGYKGYLQSDGYGVYESVSEKELKGTVTHFVCWAHARRELYEVKDHAPGYIMPILSLIGRLYLLERRIKLWKFSSEVIVKLRQSISGRYLAEIKTRLDACPDPLPKGLVRKAVNYLLNRWDKLNTYTSVGYLQIDNNRIENGIRPVALGRKNWLFAGSKDGARKIAVVYSIINSCVMLGINPEEYLADLFSRYLDHPANRLDELTPAGWIAAKMA